MLRVIQIYWNICMLRAGPQDLPASHVLLAAALLAYAAVAVLIAHTILPNYSAAALAAAVDTLLLAVLSRGLLWARMLTKRWNQTCSALAGTGCIFEIILWPINIWQHAISNSEPRFSLPLVLVLTILVWNVAVIAHILRHALTTSLFNGALLAVLYTYVTISAFRGLFIAAG